MRFCLLDCRLQFRQRYVRAGRDFDQCVDRILPLGFAVILVGIDGKHLVIDVDSVIQSLAYVGKRRVRPFCTTARSLDQKRNATPKGGAS